MTPNDVAKKIGIPVAEWTGRCHEIAALCLVAGVTTGTLRYGLWHGPVKGKRDGHPVHHGWVEVEPSFHDAWDIQMCEHCGHVEDEHKRAGILNCCLIAGCGCEDFHAKKDGARVFDPTRFVFEQKAPYLFDAEDEHGYYDVAGDRERANNMKPLTKKGAKGKLITLAITDTSTRCVLRDFTARDPVARELVSYTKRGVRMPTGVASWLAIHPLSGLGPFAETIYTALTEAGLRAAIPIDCREIVFGDGFYGKRAELEARVADARKSVPA